MSDQASSVEKNSSIHQPVLLREFQFMGDYDAVIQLWSTAGPGVSVGSSDTPQEIRKKLERDPDLFLVAEDPHTHQIVGTVLGGFDGRRGIVYHLAVADSHRKLGVGNSLMVELEARLRQKGCIRCYLLVKTDNEDAMRFYEKRGWDHMKKIYVYGKNLQE